MSRRWQRRARLALAAGAVAVLAGQTPAARPVLATIAGASLRLTGAPVTLTAHGRMEVANGARIALAGAQARLRLARGGAVRLCGPANVSLAQGGQHALLFSLQSGAMELRYPTTVADTVLTPDFLIQTVIPPQQVATVSASVALAPNGTLCVLNRGSALSVERIWDGSQTYVINGEAMAFRSGAPPARVAACPCASPVPATATAPPRSPSAGAGPLFPRQPALSVLATPAGGIATPAGPIGQPAPPPPAPTRPHPGFFLFRFFRWIFGRR